MKIVKTQSGDFTTDGGKKVMEAFIKSTDNLKGICASFAHNDNMQLGAIQAMKEAGLKPGHDVLMVSVDYVPAMKEALAAGDANASVELRSAIGKYIYPGHPPVPEGQERTAEVGRDPVRPAYGCDARQLRRADANFRNCGVSPDFGPAGRCPERRARSHVATDGCRVRDLAIGGCARGGSCDGAN